MLGSNSEKKICPFFKQFNFSEKKNWDLNSVVKLKNKNFKILFKSKIPKKNHV